MSEGTKTLHREPAAPAEPPRPDASTSSAQPKHYRWGFLSASLVILGLMVLGEAVGRQSESARRMLADADSMDWRGWSSLIVGGLFLVCSLGLAVLQWRAVRHFFLSIKVGTSMVAIATVGVMAGVLVPQIDGFEDPEMRVTSENYEEQYKAFAYAEAYFLYHVTHLYGFGGPIEEAKQPPGGWEGLSQRLEEFGRKYGREEQKNREKEMHAAFANRAKMPYISGGKALQEVETEDGTEFQEVYVKGFVNEHEDFLRAFFDVSTTLNLNRAYKSYWFKSLMVLIAVAVGLNFLRMPVRKMFTIEKAGFAVVHLGILVMLIGGGISNHYTDRGILHLDLREAPKNTYWRHYDRSKLSKMPFWVGLDLFDRQDWRQIQVLYRGADFQSRPPEYTLWPGRKIELDYREDENGQLKPRVVLEVLGLYDHARQGEMKIREARPGESGEGPVAELLVPDVAAIMQAQAEGRRPETMEAFHRTAYLAPEHPGAALLYGPDWTYRLKGLFTDEESSIEELFPQEDRIGTLSLQMKTAGDVQAHRVPIRLGQVVDAPGGFQIEAVEATANYQQDQKTGGEIRDARPLAQQPPFAPGVWLNITPPGGGEVERRLVLEHVDAVTHGKQQDYDYPELVVDFEWEYWQSAGPPRYVLHWGPNREPVLIDEAGDRNAVIDGEVLPMSADVLPIRVRDIYRDSKFESQVQFLESRVGEDGFDASFYSDDAPGLELKISIDKGPDGVVEEVRKLAATPGGLVNVYRAPDDTFDILFYENDRTMPFEWRSVLSIYEEDPSGAWTVFSGKTGRPIGALTEQQAQTFERRFGRDAVSLNDDRDGDGERDWAGPLRLVDRGSERDREIRVNDYFTHGGFRFFQTNAIPEIPTYSGIGVVYDPGIEPVLFGMYTIILGTVIAYIVRPIVQSRRERRKAA
ncbi:MAG: magnesium transporter [Planctomycetes bacterium]|nr:magnesium transporter [Planctomycetota bacterium]